MLTSCKIVVDIAALLFEQPHRFVGKGLVLTKMFRQYFYGHGILQHLFTFQTAAELERRREKFTKELDFVFADVVRTFFLIT